MRKSDLQSKGLDLDGSIESLLLLQLAHVGLGTHDTATPLLACVVGVGHVSIFDSGNELGELTLILRSDLSQSKDGGGLKEQY